MCLNGGTLHLCDNCPRAVCHQCLPPTPDVDISDLDFLSLPAMKRHSRGAIFHTMSVSEFDVPYLTHFPPPCRVTMSRRHQKLVEKIFTCNSLSGNLAWIIP